MDWKQICDRFGIDADSKPATTEIVGYIESTVADFGYSSFVDSLRADETRAGSPIGRSDINLIPSNRKAACARILVAVSTGAGKKAALGFPKIMQRVKTHLTDCTGITRAVVILCDTWDSESFMDDHFDELQAHHRKGVRFVFVMAGAPGRVLAPVAVDFNRPR